MAQSSPTAKKALVADYDLGHVFFEGSRLSSLKSYRLPAQRQEAKKSHSHSAMRPEAFKSSEGGKTAVEITRLLRGEFLRWIAHHHSIDTTQITH